MNDNLKKLITICNKNIKSFVKEKDLLQLLPISLDKIKICFSNGKIHFITNGKESHIWNKGKLYSGLEILRRIGYSYGIELENEDIFSVTKFSLEMEALVNKGEK